MYAILKKDNVYVYAENLSYEVEHDPSFVMDCSNNYQEKSLFGSRVLISSGRNAMGYSTCDYGQITIDGIMISHFNNGNIKSSLDWRTIVAYLNQMEALGVDTFLANYKKAMEEFKENLSTQADKLEAMLSVSEDDSSRNLLISMREILYRLSCLILCLSINMYVGIDNHIYEEAHQSFINLYQEA